MSVIHPTKMTLEMVVMEENEFVRYVRMKTAFKKWHLIVKPGSQGCHCIFVMLHAIFNCLHMYMYT